MQSIRSMFGPAWKFLRLAIIALALPAQAAFSGVTAPTYCTAQEHAYCDWTGGSAADYYCNTWWSCETCCESYWETCDGYEGWAERNGDGSCGTVPET